MHCDSLINRWSLCCTQTGQRPLRVEEGDRKRAKESRTDDAECERGKTDAEQAKFMYEHARTIDF